MQTARVLVLLVLAYGGLARPAQAGMIDITIDTAALTGTPAVLAFDLIQGDFVSNFVTIQNFTTDGVLGAASASGGPVTGALPADVVLGDTQFFNELLQEITLAGTITFRLALTENFLGPTPSAFSLFMLDPNGAFPLFETSDPTGAHALFAVDITGTQFGDFRVFDPVGTPGARLTATPFTPTEPTPVPEPSTLLLLAIGLCALVWATQAQRIRGPMRARMAGEGAAAADCIMRR